MGPLSGLRVVEIAGIGPGPFCALMLSDLGAEVLRVDRASEVDLPGVADSPDRLLKRGRRSLAVDLKRADGQAAVRRLAVRADVFIESFRPGVAERLGIGPEQCLAENPALVYGRMTGWGQTGSDAQRAGHDINYVATTGVLGALGGAEQPPPPPLNLIGDFGGGGMLLAVGVLAALHEVRRSGHGQIIDAAMADGAALLATMFYGMRDMGQWSDARATNLLDGGAPFYGTYETADGKYVSVGAIEPQFYASLLEVLGIDDDVPGEQMDVASWPAMKQRIAAAFATRTRAQWSEAMDGAEACFAPVLSFDEARDYAPNLQRERFVEHDGYVQPAPAPRFSRTPAAIAAAPPLPGQHSRAALREWGFADAEADALLASGAVRAASAEDPPAARAGL
jgi:alpha-methylacyl-CoA racemase